MKRIASIVLAIGLLFGAAPAADAWPSSGTLVHTEYHCFYTSGYCCWFNVYLHPDGTYYGTYHSCVPLW